MPGAENTSYDQKCIFHRGGHAEIGQGTLCLEVCVGSVVEILKK